jgi:hypothetical protein
MHISLGILALAFAAGVVVGIVSILLVKPR